MLPCEVEGPAPDWRHMDEQGGFEAVGPRYFGALPGRGGPLLDGVELFHPEGFGEDISSPSLWLGQSLGLWWCLSSHTYIFYFIESFSIFLSRMYGMVGIFWAAVEDRLQQPASGRLLSSNGRPMDESGQPLADFCRQSSIVDQIFLMFSCIRLKKIENDSIK